MRRSAPAAVECQEEGPGLGQSLVPLPRSSHLPNPSTLACLARLRCSYLEIYNEQVFDLLARPCLGLHSPLLGHSPLCF